MTRALLADFCSFLTGVVLAPKARAWEFGYAAGGRFASRVKGAA